MLSRLRRIRPIILITMTLKNILLGTAMLIYASTLAQSPQLRFNRDGKFKIAQFTDLHLKWNDPRSDIAFECFHNVIEKEHPDLIMITGDMIYSEPAADNMRKLIQYVAKFKIPFAVTFGNHDRQQGLPNSELLKIAQESSLCLTYSTPNISGEGNCVIPILSHSKQNIASVIYCIDSHEDSPLKENGVNGYDFIHLDQIAWYISQSKQLTEQNGGTPLPSIAFFHIPVPEYAEAVANPNADLVGFRREKVCSPLINTGFFAAAKIQGDIMGMFVGHDHDNDFAVKWLDILLAYGRFSGGPTEYNHLPNGARMVELSEGQRIIHTWIRQRDGKILQDLNFPADLTK